MEGKSYKTIFDPLYGLIRLNDVESEIVHSPFYQRLRWIRQLGFSCYVFHGAEHSRFGHSIGVMFNGHKILQRIGKAVSDEDLFNSESMNDEAKFHKSVRLAALMHDLGTFPFSHTTEMSYIRFGETTNIKNGKNLPDNHEHLGSFIIKNTDYPGGITHILKKYGFDPQEISDLVKGVSPNKLGNQILHAEIDCDRMDYLLRDAHYTGLKYGEYDRDYLLHHFKLKNVAGHEILAVSDKAIHCVEDFLSARFAWYSQVIRSPRGAKFDAICEELCFWMLEKGHIIRYGQLLDQIANSPESFYGFNDIYFMGLVHKLYINGEFDLDKKIKDLAECVLFQKHPVSIKDDAFKQRLLDQNDSQGNDKILKRVREKVKEIEEVIAKKGSEDDWIVVDIPEKNIIFIKSQQQIIKNMSSGNVLLERDPVKIELEDGTVALLADVPHSIISRLENTFNFIPNVYCSDSAHKLLISEKIITE